MNMSYCRFENTFGDLKECATALETLEWEQREDTTYRTALSESEQTAAIDLLLLAQQMVANVKGECGVDEENEFDEDDLAAMFARWAGKEMA